MSDKDPTPSSHKHHCNECLYSAAAGCAGLPAPGARSISWHVSAGSAPPTAFRPPAAATAQRICHAAAAAGAAAGAAQAQPAPQHAECGQVGARNKTAPCFVTYTQAYRCSAHINQRCVLGSSSLHHRFEGWPAMMSPFLRVPKLTYVVLLCWLPVDAPQAV